MMVEGLDRSLAFDHAEKNPEVVPKLRQIGDRLAADSWHIDAILPPHSGDMVYEDLQPVAAAIQGTPQLKCTIEKSTPPFHAAGRCLRESCTATELSHPPCLVETRDPLEMVTLRSNGPNKQFVLVNKWKPKSRF